MGPSWRWLSDELARLRDTALRAGELYTSMDLALLPRYAAALAMERYGWSGQLEGGLLLNVAAMALTTLRSRLTIHRLSDGAARLVRETELRAFPGEPPRLLRGPWVLETRRPELPLFGQTSSLGGYPAPGTAGIYLLGFLYPEGARGTLWRPRWEERDLDRFSSGDEAVLLDDPPEAYREWAHAAIRFAVVFAALLEAEATILRVSEIRENARGKRVRQENGVGSWRVERRVYISDEGRVRTVRPRDEAPAGGGPSRAGQIPERVRVSGHLKRQFYGPGRQGRKWIYVAPYESTRWVSQRPLWVTVKSLEERRRRRPGPGA